MRKCINILLTCTHRKRRAQHFCNTIRALASLLASPLLQPAGRIFGLMIFVGTHRHRTPTEHTHEQRVIRAEQTTTSVCLRSAATCRMCARFKRPSGPGANATCNLADQTRIERLRISISKLNCPQAGQSCNFKLTHYSSQTSSSSSYSFSMMMCRTILAGGGANRSAKTTRALSGTRIWNNAAGAPVAVSYDADILPTCAACCVAARSQCISLARAYERLVRRQATKRDLQHRKRTSAYTRAGTLPQSARNPANAVMNNSCPLLCGCPTTTM